MPLITIIQENGTVFECLFDEEDKELVEQFTWYINDGYVRRSGDGKCMHRIIMNQNDPKKKVDHINGNKSDNRKVNLRNVSDSLNSQNKPKKPNCSSLYIGVSNKQGKWEVGCRGKKKRLFEWYESELHAAYAYDLIAKEIHGNGAKTNDIEKPVDFVRYIKKNRDSNHHLHHIQVQNNSRYQVSIRKDKKIIYRKTFEKEEEAILNRDIELKKIEDERIKAVLATPIKRNADGIAIIQCSSKSAPEIIYTLVDDDDYYSIMIESSLCICVEGYVSMNKTKARLHRWLFREELDKAEDKTLEIDHINNIRIDNRKSINLQMVTRIINSRNKRKRIGISTSQYIGVHKKGNNWKAQINSGDKKIINVGTYETEILAAVARDEMIKEMDLNGFKMNNLIFL